MPIPGWCQNDVSALHVDSLTMDSCEATFAFDNEAHGEGRMSVGWSSLVRHYELKSSVDRIRSKWSVCKCQYLTSQRYLIIVR